MKILVLGGTGTVGSQVVRELLARRASVHVLTRSPERAKALPPGVTPVTGDLLDPATIRSGFVGMDGVFLLNAVSTTETHEGIMAVNGVRMAGVKRLVYLSVQDADRAPFLPHFGSKVAIELVVKTSGVPYTILRPSNFFQNDYWLKDAMLQHGVYPAPLGTVGVSRVDVRDIAEVAANALVDGAHAGETLNVVGPDPLTGPEVAAIWSRALGREIRYGGDDLDAWESQSLRILPAWAGFDFRLMYAHFQRHGLRAGPGDVERVTAALGHPPRRLEDFARETAAGWKA